jgi:hypothetical protein
MEKLDTTGSHYQDTILNIHHGPCTQSRAWPHNKAHTIAPSQYLLDLSLSLHAGCDFKSLVRFNGTTENRKTVFSQTSTRYAHFPEADKLFL